MTTKGWITVGGVDVLVQQGIAQFEIFTGKPAPVHTMRRVVQEQASLMMQEQQELVSD